MMQGSYESEKMYHYYAPHHVPEPMSGGCYAANPSMYFYLCRFHDMVDEMPAPKIVVPIVAGVHKASMGTSPKSAYGFHVTTHLGNLPNDNTWQTSWEAWFQQAMRQMFRLEEEAHGKDPQLEALKEGLHEKVIPRLLRPLETGGRSIQPCLIYSDIWPGNMMSDSETHELIIFDSCAYWGHNESDLGTWRTSRYKLGMPFIKEYQNIMGISEPQADWDDRNALYSIRYDLIVSTLHAKDIKFRRMAMTEMQRLVSKYPEGYDGFSESIEDPTTADDDQDPMASQTDRTTSEEQAPE